MKIAVMGAGAVGCYYGGLLARAGHEVALVGRPHHVQAIQAHGLCLETQAFTEQVALHAGTKAALVRGAELVLVCVKSTDTETAAQAMQPHLDPSARVLSLQNGVDNAARLSEPLQRPVSAAVVYVAAAMAGPGHVRHHGRGDLILGTDPIGEQAATLFESAGVPVQRSDQVDSALWGKLIVNCAVNALSAISQCPYGTLRAHAGVIPVLRDVVNECLAVAQATGVTLHTDPWLAVQAVLNGMPTQRSSTAQDLARQKPTEIQHLNGHIVRLGERLGIPTPANRVLLTLVELMEAQFSRPTA